MSRTAFWMKPCKQLFLSEETLEGVLNEVTKAFTTAISIALCRVGPQCAFLDSPGRFPSGSVNTR